MTETKIIHYRKDDKYALAEAAQFVTQVHPPEPLNLGDGLLMLDPDGLLRIHTGYAWDGPSGPALDTHTFMRASLAHDALYQLMRERKLDHSFRGAADNEMRRLTREDCMWAPRRWWTYFAVDKGADLASRTGRPILFAPHRSCA